jgi:hypothetical protein
MLVASWLVGVYFGNREDLARTLNFVSTSETAIALPIASTGLLDIFVFVASASWHITQGIPICKEQEHLIEVEGNASGSIWTLNVY